MIASCSVIAMLIHELASFHTTVHHPSKYLRVRLLFWAAGLMALSVQGIMYHSI
jgi:hypothetical protein